MVRQHGTLITNRSQPCIDRTRWSKTKHSPSHRVSQPAQFRDIQDTAFEVKTSSTPQISERQSIFRSEYRRYNIATLCFALP
jgi:hypothetical protein